MEAGAARSPTVAAMAPPLMIQGRGEDVGGGGRKWEEVGGEDVSPWRHGLAPNNLFARHVSTWPFSSQSWLPATPTCLLPRPRDSPAPSGTAEVPYAICAHTPENVP